MSVIDRDLGYREIIRNLNAMDRGLPSVLVGVRAKEGSEQVTIAAVNEFGSSDGHVPERSYLRSTMDENKKAYLDALTRATGIGVDDGTAALRRELGKIGAKAASDVQRKIRDIDTPPNAASTIAKKGFDNPLIETGRLRQSIDWEIED